MLVLRLSGVIVGPVAVVLAAICFVLAPGPRRLSDRFIVFFAIGFGWMMLLGWIPRLETSIDVPGILLAGVLVSLPQTSSTISASDCLYDNGRLQPKLPPSPSEQRRPCGGPSHSCD